MKATIVSQPMFFTEAARWKISTGPTGLSWERLRNDAVLALKQIFHPLVMRGVPVIVTNHETAELVRESATAFVATKISFINELATLVRARERRRRQPGHGAGTGQENRSPLPAAGSRHGRTSSPSPTWIRWPTGARQGSFAESV